MIFLYLLLLAGKKFMIYNDVYAPLLRLSIFI